LIGKDIGPDFPFPTSGANHQEVTFLHFLYRVEKHRPQDGVKKERYIGFE